MIMSRRLKAVLVHSGLLAAAVLAFASHEFGATWHSVIGIAVMGFVAWHVITHRRWVKSAVRRRMRHPERVGYNSVLVTMFLIANLSGFPIWFWDVGGVLLQIHELTGVAFVLMVFGHLGLNGRRLVARLRPRRPGRESGGTSRCPATSDAM